VVFEEGLVLLQVLVFFVLAARKEDFVIKEIIIAPFHFVSIMYHLLLKKEILNLSK
jgi:hypothetical protein